MNLSRPFEIPAFLRTLFLISSAVVYSSILGPPAIVSSFLDRSGRWPSFFQKLWVNWLLRANGIHLQISGLENFKEGHSYVLVSNHASILDIPAMISAAPFPVRFIAKKSLLWYPVFGWFLYFSGHILIDRESPRSALKSLKKATLLLKGGISVIVFPEGTRSPDGEVKDFKRGAFLLAQHSKFPVVPVSIAASYEMLPRQGWCFWPGTLHMRMGEPVPTRGLSQQESRNLMNKVRNTIVENIEKGRAQQEAGNEERNERPHEAMQETGCRV